jgi:hypothetical protein
MVAGSCFYNTANDKKRFENCNEKTQVIVFLFIFNLHIFNFRVPNHSPVQYKKIINRNPKKPPKPKLAL